MTNNFFAAYLAVWLNENELEKQMDATDGYRGHGVGTWAFDSAGGDQFPVAIAPDFGGCD